MLQLNLQKSVEKSHMSECQSVSAVPNAEPQLDWFWTFFPFFVSFLQGTSKKDWQHVKVFWSPQLKNLKFVMLWPQLLRSISNCVIRDFSSHQCQPNQIYCTAGEALFTLCAGLWARAQACHKDRKKTLTAWSYGFDASSRAATASM